LQQARDGIPLPTGTVEEPLIEDGSLALTLGATLRVGLPLAGTTLRPFTSGASSDPISGSLGGGLSLRAGIGYRTWDFFAMYDYAYLAYSDQVGDSERGVSHRALFGVGRYLFAPRNPLNVLLQVAAGAEAFSGQHLRTSQVDGVAWSAWEIIPTTYVALSLKWRVSLFHVLAGPYVTASLDSLMSSWLADRTTNIEAGLTVGVDFHSNSFNPGEPRALQK